MSLAEELAIFENYSSLAYGVIVQAAEDYFEYSRAVMRGQSKYGQDKKTMQKHLDKVIDFFQNKDGYYKFYSTVIDANSSFNLSGEKIMKMLDIMIADEEKYPEDSIKLASSF